MLLMIASGLLFTEMKVNVLKLFSNIVRVFWNKWELRGMVVLSLCLQIVLIALGSRRKYTANHWIAFFVWSTYLLADWMATVSLSTLLRGQGEINSVLVVFWAPFLLLHLGGPDTITAYSLEDNELWVRHLLGLVIQVGVALYVYFSFRTNDAVTYLAIPIFVAGIIKYGERIYILWSSSSKQFSKFLFSGRARKPQEVTERSFPTPQLGPYEQEGFISNKAEELDSYLTNKHIIPQAKYLHEAYLSYKMFIPLFSDLTLRFHKDSEGIFSTLKSKSAADAFKVVETELGFLYDVLYTKMTILHTLPGDILRFICFLSYISAFVAFLVISGNDDYQKVDIAISYLLLVGAMFLDIYAAIAHVISNWAMFWLTCKKGLANSIYMVIASLYVLIYRKRESRSMAQHNLINFCLELKATKFNKVDKILDTYKILETYTIVGKYWHTTWEDVEVGMKNFIFSHILAKYNRYKEASWQSGFLKKLLSERGDYVLEEVYKLDFSETVTTKLEFEHSLLVWHIATDLCYYDDHNTYRGTGLLERKDKISNLLSNYMLYLLLMRSDMMPKGISGVRYRDSCAEVVRVFQYQRNLDRSKVRMNLLDLPGFRLEIPEFRDKSVIFDGVQLAKKLQSLVTESRWDLEEKWEMISLVWVEMLTYAAGHCGWNEHCQQLRRGGELLTLVCLLMAHFGLSSQIRLEDSDPEDHKPPSSWNWESLDQLAYYLA